MSNLGSIFPQRWIPPFLRNQFMQEEVAETRVRVCGFYRDAELDGAKFKFHAERETKDYTVRFSKGIIYLCQGE